ncbi:MAG: PEP-CTERM sorting domain-containing protein [Myxococcota bacterium]|jgi:hypothetical protein|nr:PEP-CTERM sorting domain-containing protein [Myxococcota bacterium]
MLKHFPRAAAATLFALIVSVAPQAIAAPIGAEAPMPGYHTNSGVERFESTGWVFAIELKDSPGGEFGEFGIYYDTDTRITLFGADDMGSGQAAKVDLVGGSVMDVDSATDDFFDARNGDFGFYFAKNDEFVYTETHLNAHLKIPLALGTYESMRSPDQFLITLEWWDTQTKHTWAIEAVGGIRPSTGGGPTNAVPEPSAAMLFGFGALVMRSAIRRR